MWTQVTDPETDAFSEVQKVPNNCCASLLVFGEASCNNLAFHIKRLCTHHHWIPRNLTGLESSWFSVVLFTTYSTYVLSSTLKLLLPSFTWSNQYNIVSIIPCGRDKQWISIWTELLQGLRIDIPLGKKNCKNILQALPAKSKLFLVVFMDGYREKSICSPWLHTTYQVIC